MPNDPDTTTARTGPDERLIGADDGVGADYPYVSRSVGPGRETHRRGEVNARETMVCAFRPWSVPRAFPVVHRPAPATRRLVQVASENGRVLLCDDAHGGDHMWPTGEMVPVDTWQPDLREPGATIPGETSPTEAEKTMGDRAHDPHSIEENVT